MMRKTNASNKKRLISLLSLILILAVLTLIPLPYYIYQPGTIEKLADFVNVENGHASEKGSFNLTTVLSIKANNALTLLYGLFAKDTEIRKSEKVRGTLTDAEYGILLEHMMKSSQNNAVVASLEAAGRPVPMTYTGVFVQALYAESKAAGVLLPGDVIVEAEGKPVTRINELASVIVKNKKIGDKLELAVLRGKERLTLSIELYGDDEAVPRIGIVSEDQYTINPPVSVIYTESEIGGPSAGLMFSLEILDQLTEGELTHGKLIAGTGTIDAGGNVGQIGGIRDKIIAAELAGVDIFFCPADVKASDSNEKDILDEARKRGYKVTIVPVHTLAEAVNYLERLGA
jgi:PDZ domain-containing protein